MSTTDSFPAEFLLEVDDLILIEAPIEIAFETLLEQLGPMNETPDGDPLPMMLEAWPGGRWMRDLGENSGHLWGHVQVIKPPTLLEVSGPLFMSYPVCSHVQYRLTLEGDTTHLTLKHRAMGLIEQDHRDGVTHGWNSWSTRVKKFSEERANR